MRRRTATVLVALALTGCGSHNGSSPRYAPLPTSTVATSSGPVVGPPPEIPWWSRGVLHVSEGTIRTSNSHLIARGGTTIVGPYHGNGSWLILRGDQLVPLVAKRDSVSPPVLSANGRFAAWTTSKVVHRYTQFVTDSSFTVTAYDVGRGRVSGTTTIESRVSCCDGGGAIEVAGVDADGSVVIGRYADRVWMWRPGRALAPLTGEVRIRNVSGDPWPGGVSWVVGGDSADPAAFGRVSEHGVVTRLDRVPQSQGGVWSPGGDAYAYAPFFKIGKVRPVVWRDGHRLVLHAPRGAWPVAWESDTRVLLVVGDLDASVPLVRCWVTDGHCEQAGKPLQHAHLPLTAAY